MNSLILQTATRVLAPALALFALFMFLRGHDQPGGGFIGGLLLAAALALVALAHGVDAARRVLRVDPVLVLAIGLGAAALAAVASLATGAEPLTVLWSGIPIPGFGKLGTALLFDAGVLLVVVGAFTCFLSGFSGE
jgi:multicomponent Na+:H+ antiporter subunit B